MDFEPGGVGGDLLERIGMPPVDGHLLPGDVAWLRDRCITLHRDAVAWSAERHRVLGDSPAHRRFWNLMDRLVKVFWQVSHPGVSLFCHFGRGHRFYLINAKLQPDPTLGPIRRAKAIRLGEFDSSRKIDGPGFTF